MTRPSKGGHRPGRLRRLLGIIGPGFVTGASDDDPSGVATYAIAGASFGYATLWTVLVTLPLMAGMQLIAARIALQRGTGLGRVMRDWGIRAPWIYLLILPLVVANTINIGADLGAIGAAVELLVDVDGRLTIVVVGVLLLVLLWRGSYRLISGLFKWLTLALLAYVGAAVLAGPDLGETLKGTFLPTIHFDAEYLALFTAILGTTITPYMWFWQASQEVQEQVEEGNTSLRERRGTSRTKIAKVTADTAVGMGFSNLVMYFIILGTAATLFENGERNITSAADAAAALEPIAGQFAALLFSLGIIGAGLLAIPVLAGAAAYALSDALGWNEGLNRSVSRAPGFYAIIAVAVMIGVAINFLPINAFQALFYSAVINGLIAPPIMVVLVAVAGSRKMMGQRVSGGWLSLLGWVATAMMTVAALVLVGTWLIG